MRMVVTVTLVVTAMVGCSSADNTPTEVTADLSAPTNLTATRIGMTAVQLRWTDNSNSEETSDAEATFAIERATSDSAFVPKIFVTKNVTTALDSTGLQIDSTYTYRVAAVRYTKYSKYSNVVSVTITSTFP